MAATSADEQPHVLQEVPDQLGDQAELQEPQGGQPEQQEEPDGEVLGSQQEPQGGQPEQQEELDGEVLGSQEEQSAAPGETEAPTFAADELATQVGVPLQAPASSQLLATQVMAPEDADLLATQVMAPMDADLLATHAMAPMDADMLATQAMAPMDADLLATQVMAPVEADLLATQVIRPADPAVQTTAQMDGDRQVEFQKPVALKEVKRPRTAFRLFAAEVRSQVVQEVGTGNVSKIATALGAKWKSLDESEKAKYVEEAKVLRCQYDKKIADGAIPARSASEKKTARVAAKKATKAAKRKAAKRRALENLKRRAGPKKPQPSYSIWLCENRKHVRDKLVADGNSEPSFKDIAKAAGKTWMALGEAEKAPFVERARLLASKFKDISNACKEFQKAKKATKKDAKAKAAAKQKAGEAKKKVASQAASKDKKPAAAKATKQQLKALQAEEEKVASSESMGTPRKGNSGALRPTPKKAKKAPVEQKAYLDMSLVMEAEKLGFASTFQKLAEREDMMSYPQRSLLDALVASGGLLHRAREAVFAGCVIQG